MWLPLSVKSLPFTAVPPVEKFTSISSERLIFDAVAVNVAVPPLLTFVGDALRLTAGIAGVGIGVGVGVGVDVGVGVGVGVGVSVGWKAMG